MGKKEVQNQNLQKNRAFWENWLPLFTSLATDRSKVRCCCLCLSCVFYISYIESLGTHRSPAEWTKKERPEVEADEAWEVAKISLCRVGHRHLCRQRQGHLSGNWKRHLRSDELSWVVDLLCVQTQARLHCNQVAHTHKFIYYLRSTISRARIVFMLLCAALSTCRRRARVFLISASISVERMRTLLHILENLCITQHTALFFIAALRLMWIVYDSPMLKSQAYNSAELL